MNGRFMVVTGGMGRLAIALRAEFPDALYPTRHELDVADPDSVRRYFMDAAATTVIVHTAAVTYHSATASDLIRTNVLGTCYVAEYAKALGATLVYCSTDYVYPGTVGHYRETDPCAPIGGYAWSKFAGEKFVEGVPGHLIVRGSWYGKIDWKFAAADSYSSKVHVTEAAKQIAALIRAGARGIVNVGGPRRTLYEIALDRNELVEPCGRRELVGLPYDLPRDVSLDLTRYRDLVG